MKKPFTAPASERNAMRIKNASGRERRKSPLTSNVWTLDAKEGNNAITAMTTLRSTSKYVFCRVMSAGVSPDYLG
jgi:hypothetical protein